jgi:hypothetical protein
MPEPLTWRSPRCDRHDRPRHSPRVCGWMDDAVASHLTELARAEHEEPVLIEMKARAQSTVPIVASRGTSVRPAQREVGAMSAPAVGLTRISTTPSATQAPSKTNSPRS